MIFDNGAPDLRTGYGMTDWIDADQFVLTSATAIQNITFWEVEGASDFQGSVVWEIFADDNNNPGQLVASGTSTGITHSATGRTAPPSFPEYKDSFAINTVSLTPGTYWLALHNGPLSYSPREQTYWETASNSSSIPSQTKITPFTGEWWSDYANSKLAFQVVGLVLPQVISISSRPAPVFSFTSTSGQTYRVEYKNSLTDASWTTVAGYGSVSNNNNANGNTIRVTDPDSNVRNLSHRFYHVVAVQ